MTISLTERARQNRLVALRALAIKKNSTDGGVVMLNAQTRELQKPVFSSRRSTPMPIMSLAA